MAIFLLIQLVPLPLDEGGVVKGGGEIWVERGDVTSWDGGRRDERGGVFIHVLTLQEVKNEN